MIPTLLMFLGLTFTVVQQPATNTLFVSPLPDVVTQHARVNTDCWNGYNSNIGLLAEERQTGQYVGYLKIGDEIVIDYGYGYEEIFIVSEVLRYRAASSGVLSNFVDEETGAVYTSLQLGNFIYCRHPRRLILQTCLYDGYGRLIIEAMPVLPERNKKIIQMK